MYQVDCSVVGVSPLLHHRFPMPDYADLGKGGTKNTGAKDYVSVTTAVATALNDQLARVAVAVRLGGAISDASLRLVQWQEQLPKRWRLWRWAVNVRDPWLRTGTEACGIMLGLGLALGMRSAAFELSFALLGAQMVVDGVQKLEAPYMVGVVRWREPVNQGLLLVLVLTAVSLKLRVPAASRRTYWAQLVRVATLPFAIVESALRRFTGKAAAAAAAALVADHASSPVKNRRE